ncbi:MAG: hypothetical protein IPK68_05425 [Bdellovibrionales bacterium]|nr:hypothetical protein [Bdellovibrionales bacterium]
MIRRPSDINTAAGPQAFGDSVMSKRHRELAELNLRGSGSSSAWCSAHNVSAAAGRMFEDPGLLRLGSAGTLGVWNNNQAGQFKNNKSMDRLAIEDVAYLQ